jgi:UDP-N-acetylmuramoyl-tripeptide--D-alanyl-D-alanine ligase
MKALGKLYKRLRTPFGRMELWKDILTSSWPLLRVASGIHRRTLLRRTCIITVTGTYGKTTAARAITMALGGPENRPEIANSKSGLAKALLITPPWRSNAVFEVGIIEPGEMVQYARMFMPRIVVITSIGLEHQRNFGSVETLRSEKAKMLSLLPRDGTAILNGDDPNVYWMKSQTDRRVITYGFSETNDVRAINFHTIWPSGTRFECQIAGRSIPVFTRLHGKVMIYPALAAFSAALATGRNLDEVPVALEKMQAIRGRMQVFTLPGGAIVIQDEFKSSPETIEAAIDFLKEIPACRRILVLGEIDQITGSIGPVYRDLAARFGSFADRLILLGGNAYKFSSGAHSAGMEHQKISNCRKALAKAIEILRSELRDGDVVLVKGRSRQHLERIGLALKGKNVRCQVFQCQSRAYRCDTCPVLETGWDAEQAPSAN